MVTMELNCFSVIVAHSVGSLELEGVLYNSFLSPLSSQNVLYLMKIRYCYYKWKKSHKNLPGFDCRFADCDDDSYDGDDDVLYGHNLIEQLKISDD